MSITYYSSGSILNYLFGKTAWTNPATLYIGLATNGTGTVNISYISASSMTEPVSASYARTSITNDKSANGFEYASGGQLVNAKTLTFPESSGSWGTINYIFITDASGVGAGNVLYWEQLDTPKAVSSETTVVFSGSALTIKMDNT